jgi:hypothetical protein
MIVDYQCAFWHNITSDWIFSICHILERKWEYNQTVHQPLFMALVHQLPSLMQHNFYFKMSFTVTFKIHKMSLKHILFNCWNMFRPYKAILRQLLIDWNRHTASSHMSVFIYMLLLHVVVIWECTPTIHSLYFHNAVSTLCSFVCSSP